MSPDAVHPTRIVLEQTEYGDETYRNYLNIADIDPSSVDA